MANKYVPLGKRITWEGYKTPINDINLNYIESRIQNISDYLENIQKSGMILGKGVIIGDTLNELSEDTSLIIRDGDIDIASFSSSDIKLFHNTATKDTTPYKPLLHIHMGDTIEDSFIIFHDKQVGQPVSQSAEAHTIIIRDANGRASINTPMSDAQIANKEYVDSTNNIFIRYSANEDGTGMTEEWSEGQNYIGFATGQTAPTEKGGYEWVLLLKGEKGNDGKDGQDSDGLAEFSPNLVNPAEFEEGKYLSSASILENSSYYMTGYFRVNGGQTYYYYHSKNNNNLIGSRRIVFYDTDKKYISMIDYNTITDTRAFTAPENAVYARMSNLRDYGDMAVYETSIEAYIPYYKRLREDVELINHIDNTLSIEGKAADAKAVGEIKARLPVVEECWKYGDSDIIMNAHWQHGYFSETDAANALCCTDYIPVKLNDHFAGCYVKHVALFDEYKTLLTHYQVSASDNYYGNIRISDIYITDENVAYAVFTMSYYYGFCAVSRIDSEPYEVLCLGDSIFGNNPKPYDIPTLIQSVTQRKAANCGFGGTTARTHHSATYAPLSFHNIADCIASGDFSTIDIDWLQHGDFVYKRAVDILKGIDYSKLKVLTVAFGTNDWNLSTATDKIDNTENRLDVTTYKGALRHGIEAVLTAYPHILICLLSPLYRTWSNDSSDYKIVDDDSDNRVNAHGVKLMDYVTAMKEVAEEYHLPFFDNYSTMGINRITAPSILRDGTHLNYYAGVERVGGKIAEEINSII